MPLGTHLKLQFTLWKQMQESMCTALLGVHMVAFVTKCQLKFRKYLLFRNLYQNLKVSQGCNRVTHPSFILSYAGSAGTKSAEIMITELSITLPQPPLLLQWIQ